MLCAFSPLKISVSERCLLRLLDYERCKQALESKGCACHLFFSFSPYGLFLLTATLSSLTHSHPPIPPPTPTLARQITKWNERAIDVELPPNYIYEVVETDPNFKGNTAQGGSKPAKLNSGATVTVPMFIEVGEKIKVDTREATYVSRGES